MNFLQGYSYKELVLDDIGISLLCPKKDNMKILIACEFSGIVRDAFTRMGHDAMSCDLLPSDKPGKHYQGDVFDIIGDGFDMMIAHPPCTYLTVTANRSFLGNPDRWRKRLAAVLFVWDLLNAPIEKIAIENPKGVLSSHIRKPDQYVQPYQFGHTDSKMTGLWLKNLDQLKPTKIVEPEWVYPASGSGKRMSKKHAINPSTNNPKNAKLRSLTYQGIANAMARQWGGP